MFISPYPILEIVFIVFIWEGILNSVKDLLSLVFSFHQKMFSCKGILKIRGIDARYAQINNLPNDELKR